MMEEFAAYEQPAEPRGPHVAFRRLCNYIFVLLLIGSAVVTRVSLMTGSVRALLAATILFGVFTGLVHLTILFFSRPRLLYPALFFTGLFVVWAVLGNKPPDVEVIRLVYLRQLQAYTGTRYVWGGETHSGIDCSGIARAAFWQTVLKEGVRAFNSDLLGPKLWKFWWRDLSANDLLIGRYGYTRKIGEAAKLAGYSNSGLKPGDLAIAGSGSHVLVYLGNKEWIEANPDDGKVVTNVAAPHSKRPYFNMPVILMRWWILAGSPEIR
ncbi:MAG: C40 family peptidase [Armatimonadetes bacterium]|nr:C40 family peptidase [Armatimonadota bacterium]